MTVPNSDTSAAGTPQAVDPTQAQAQAQAERDRAVIAAANVRIRQLEARARQLEERARQLEERAVEGTITAQNFGDSVG